MCNEIIGIIGSVIQPLVASAGGLWISEYLREKNRKNREKDIAIKKLFIVLEHNRIVLFEQKEILVRLLEAGGRGHVHDSELYKFSPDKLYRHNFEKELYFLNKYKRDVFKGLLKSDQFLSILKQTDHFSKDNKMKISPESAKFAHIKKIDNYLGEIIKIMQYLKRYLKEEDFNFYESEEDMNRKKMELDKIIEKLIDEDRKIKTPIQDELFNKIKKSFDSQKTDSEKGDKEIWNE